MSLSKKNLDKLNNLIKDKNLIDDKNSAKYEKRDKNDKSSKNQPNPEDPSKIFYSLIDNSETLSETSEINYKLRKSEEDYITFNSLKNDYSKHLAIEDELYDEFDYLLEE